MANDFAITQKAVIDANIMLVDELLGANLANRGYEGQFSPGFGNTVNVSIPTKGDGTLWDGTGTIPVNNIAQTEVPIVMEYYATHRVQITEAQKKYEMSRFQDQVIRPAVSAINDKVENFVLRRAMGGFTTNIVGTPGSEISTHSHLINAEQTIFENTSENNKYVGLISANSAANLRKLDIMNSRDFRDDVPDAIRNGLLGETENITLFRSPYNTQVNTTDTAGTVLVDGASQTGTSLVTDGYTAATGTVYAGTQITITGVTGTYTVTDDTSIAANAATLPITPALASSPADDAAITFLTGAIQNVIYDPRAFAVLVLPLSPAANTTSSNIGGIGLSLTVSDRDTSNLQEEWVWACHVGAQVLQPALGCVPQG